MTHVRVFIDVGAIVEIDEPEADRLAIDDRHGRDQEQADDQDRGAAVRTATRRSRGLRGDVAVSLNGRGRPAMSFQGVSPIDCAISRPCLQTILHLEPEHTPNRADPPARRTCAAIHPGGFGCHPLKPEAQARREGPFSSLAIRASMHMIRFRIGLPENLAAHTTRAIMVLRMAAR